MQTPIFLSSDDASSNSKSHNFTTVFTPEIVLDYHQAFSKQYFTIHSHFQV